MDQGRVDHNALLGQGEDGEFAPLAGEAGGRAGRRQQQPAAQQGCCAPGSTARRGSVGLVILAAVVALSIFHVARHREDSPGSPLRNPCQDAPADHPPKPFCDMNLSLHARAIDYVQRLTLAEKAAMLGNAAGAAKSVNTQAYQWWNEALHGVAKSPGVTFKGKIETATSFPLPLVTASSLNRTLFRAIGAAISTEARAFGNAGQSGLTFWTPNINLFRDPRWGRGLETPGEDPTINGDYAAEFVRGFQEGEDPAYLRASACCKHFAAYSMENSDGEDRMHFDAQVTHRDMIESFLPAFEACVKRGKVSSIMCSYNAINGYPSCANSKLLQDFARDRWGFDGYITGDCGAVASTFNRYHFRSHTALEVVRDTLESGVDIACDNFLHNNVKLAVEENVVDEALVDRAIVNLVKVQMRLGYFDRRESQPYLEIGPESVNTAAAQQLAHEAAQQGMVLLKNDGVLPLDRAQVADVAVIGPQATRKDVLLGNYEGIPPFIVTVADGVKNFTKKAKVLEGCKFAARDSPESMLVAAEEAAKHAAQTFLAVGLDLTIENEGRDRLSLEFPGRQHELVKRVAAAAVGAGKPPVVVIVVAAGAVDISAELADPNVGAILWAGYSGMYGGLAAAETIYGVNNPSGRLTQTFYPADFANKVKMSNMHMHPDSATGFPGRTYRFYTGPTVLPFGHGLSYTSFHFNLTAVEAGDGDTKQFRVQVRNVGQRTGASTMMVFARPPQLAVANGEHADLHRALVDFDRTPDLQPDESHELFVSIATSQLRVFKHHDDEVGDSLSELGAWQLEFLGGETPLVLEL